MKSFATLAGLAALSALAVADVPIDCARTEVEGEWVFIRSPNSFDSRVNCTGYFDSNPYTDSVPLTLAHPDVVVGPGNVLGRWTMVYNEAFEVRWGGYIYMGFFKYAKIPDSNNTLSYCGQTQEGTFHTHMGDYWGCFQARRANIADAQKEKISEPDPVPGPVNDDTNGMTDYTKWLMSQNLNGQVTVKEPETQQETVELINKVQNSWVAAEYPEDMMETIDASLLSSKPFPSIFKGAKVAKMGFGSRHRRDLDNIPSEASDDYLPESFDWRNVSGVSYDSPVRDQGKCGSCYAFASASLLEARWRIYSSNREQPVLSTQDIVSCSPVTQGCAGGFSYLTAGKYAHDYGMVDESCYPYEGKDSPCDMHRHLNCRKHYVSNYYYIGGFFGAGNEKAMMRELLTNGPIAVGIEVFSDFRSYKSGVYHYTGVQGKYGRLVTKDGRVTVNHAVVVVGFGVENGDKYWIVKNSWNEKWGDKGYIKIRRGNDEIGIESMPVATFPKV